LPEDRQKYIVTGAMQRLTIKYLNPDLPNTFYVYPSEINSIQPADKNNFEIIFTGADWEKINATRNNFLDIKFEERKNKFGDTFYTLKY